MYVCVYIYIYIYIYTWRLSGDPPTHITVPQRGIRKGGSRTNTYLKVT